MTRKRNQSKKKPGPDEYRLDEAAAREMGELLKLKLRGVASDVVASAAVPGFGEHAAAYLAALPLTKYGRLVVVDAQHAHACLHRFLDDDMA